MLKYQIVKFLIDLQTKDLLKFSDQTLKSLHFQSSRDVKKHSKPVIGFSPTMSQERNSLQQLLNEKLYHHFRVERMTQKAKRIIQDLFNVYEINPNQLPYSVYQRGMSYNQETKYRIICNHIASMTDRFALDEHKRLFDPYQKV